MARRPAFWDRLSTEQRKELRDAGSTWSYRTGEIIIQADNQRNLVIIMKGMARVVASATNGGTYIFAIRRQHDVLGELTVLGNSERYARVEAMGPVEGLKLAARQVTGLLRQDPEIREILNAVARERLHEADEHRIMFATARVRPRTAWMLVKLAEQDTPAGCDVPERIDIMISQNDLAGLVGTDRVSVARALDELRKAQIVEKPTTRKKITVVDIGRLRDVAATQSTSG
jgi:CRP/FNR family cyclic AMP-dependent transcriptional regulator